MVLLVLVCLLLLLLLFNLIFITIIICVWWGMSVPLKAIREQLSNGHSSPLVVSSPSQVARLVWHVPLPADPA